jgi:hypothetical protein
MPFSCLARLLSRFGFFFLLSRSFGLRLFFFVTFVLAVLGVIMIVVVIMVVLLCLGSRSAALEEFQIIFALCFALLLLALENLLGALHTLLLSHFRQSSCNAVLLDW